jgi:nucleoside-diphosphate-sugar epimerase
MKIFITGASGFEGGAAAKALAKDGHEIYAMARSEKSSAKIKSLGATPVTCEASSLPKGLVRRVADVSEFFWKLFGAKNPPPVTRIIAYMMSANFVLKNDKEKKDLGYKPVISFEQGMSRLKENYK